jgi:hypothetical protein
MQNKMNLSIFYAEVQPIFAFWAKIVQTECRIKELIYFLCQDAASLRFSASKDRTFQARI